MGKEKDGGSGRWEDSAEIGDGMGDGEAAAALRRRVGSGGCLTVNESGSEDEDEDANANVAEDVGGRVYANEAAGGGGQDGQKTGCWT